MRARIVRETTPKFCTVIKLDARKFLRGRSQMLTRDLFAVANLPVAVSVRHFLKISANLGKHGRSPSPVVKVVL